ncbi:GTP-binding protein [Pseudomonas sp. PDNC002]|uniref:CobW family GTP-binding protein n=1 Tax=Pseudomonas sp. PDNC002 TaxID=2811422 RepID=UPI001965B6CF|nr:GTP-binding protein [Pseudomonas sp. PDNC002]QRY78193.1 GTP-binding protein [Pseudomonas sp. PDNC002]
MNAASIPVTVVAGFLGAGKTTLLRDLLERCEGRRLAVIVNDFGELNIDAGMIAEQTEAVYSLENGCICCTVQDDLLAQLERLANMHPPLEQVVIECSGVSDPQRIVQTLGYPKLRRRLHLDAVLTVVDGARREPLEGEYARLERMQAAAADLLLLNKCDLLDTEERSAQRARFGRGARVLETIQARIPDELLLGEPSRKLRPGAQERVDHGDLFESWSWQGEAIFDGARLKNWLETLPRGLLRLKGLIRLTGQFDALWLQYVGGRYQLRPATVAEAAQGSRLVFIAERNGGLRADLESGLHTCFS